MQSLRLRIKQPISAELERIISREVTPAYLRTQIREKGIQHVPCSDGYTLDDFATSYEKIPTEDHTLQRIGNDYYGPASGKDLAPKLFLKAIALKRIQEVLKANGIPSEMDFHDIEDEIYLQLADYQLV